MFVSEEQLDLSDISDRCLALVENEWGIIVRDGKSLFVKLLKGDIKSVSEITKVIAINLFDDNKKIIASNNPKSMIEGLKIISKDFITTYAKYRSNGLRLKIIK